MMFDHKNEEQKQNSKANILLIGPTPPPYNGMSVMLENLLKSSLKDRFDLMLLDIADRRELSNVGVLDFHNVYLAIKHGLTFLNLLIFKKPETVYLSVAQNNYGYLRDSLFLIPAIILRRKIVVHLHGSAFREYYQDTNPLMRLLISWSIARVDRLIVLGESLRDNFEGIAQKERVVVIPNGIDVTGIGYKPIEAAKNHYDITFMGTLVKSKGFQIVLESAALVLKSIPDVHYVLAGDKSFQSGVQSAEKYIAEHNLQDSVSLPGVVLGKDKELLLQNTDIFVFTPIEPEGQPLVIMEAMAHGIPVITTNHGAIPEMVQDNVTGFIVPDNDPEEVADRIIQLLTDSELRLRMGKASSERYQNYYTLDRWANDMMLIFSDVLANSR